MSDLFRNGIITDRSNDDVLAIHIFYQMKQLLRGAEALAFIPEAISSHSIGEFGLRVRVEITTTSREALHELARTEISCWIGVEAYAFRSETKGSSKLSFTKICCIEVATITR